VIKSKNIISHDDIVMFAKHDLSINDEDFIKKIKYAFDNRSDIGMIGFSGVKQLLNGRNMFHRDNGVCNGYYTKGINTIPSVYDGIVAVDDSFFAIRGSIIINTPELFGVGVDYGTGLIAALEVMSIGYGVVVIPIDANTDVFVDLEHDYVIDLLSKLDVSFPVIEQTHRRQVNTRINVEV
jgi:hypothetical protein